LGFRYAHGHKAARGFPTNELIDAAIILNILSFPWPIPTTWIKGRVAPFVGDDEVIAATYCGLNTFPALELSIGPQQDIANTAGQLGFGLENKGSVLFAAERFAFSKLSDKTFSGLFNETKYWPVSFLAPMFGVVTFAAALLVAVQRLDCGVDIDADPVITDAQLLPYPFTQNAHELKQGLSLVDAQAIEVAPEGARHRQLCQPKKSAQHGIVPDVSKMPNSVKAYKQLHQKTYHHRIDPQLGLPGRRTIGGVKYLFKNDQIVYFDHR